MKLWIGLLVAGTLCAGDDLPEWARQAAGLKASEYPAKVGMVMLLHEETLTVAPDGKRTMRERGALRILQRGETAGASRTYDTRNGRVAEFRAWLVPPVGRPVSYGKDYIVDVALDRGNLYDEARTKVLRCPEGTRPGSVFAYEIVEEEKTVFTQGAWYFQRTEPVLVSRFVLSLPPEWEARGTVFNRQSMQPAVAGNQYTWELHDLPWIESEEYSPNIYALAPWVAFSYFPSGENRAGLRPLKDWAAVSAWAAGFADPAAEVTDTVRAKAAELTRNATTELDKIRAIAAYVQQTIYVEVATNVTRGGGYVPHAAPLVLSRNYGDCKDKVALMRALLKAVGIDSYETGIFSGDRHFVRSEWPSMQQFNHAIAAIRVSPETSLPTVIEPPGLGRLLMFDPTSRTTKVGDLPESEQGSLALVSVAGSGGLVTMPRLPVTANRVESSIEAAVDGEGHLEGRIQRQYFGQSGGYWRRLLLDDGADELKRAFERQTARRLGGMSLKGCTTAGAMDDGHFDVSLEVTAKQFGQVMQDRLLFVRPGMLGSVAEYGFTGKERKWPVELNASLRHDVVHLKLPAGFEPDEVPDEVKLESSYGVYKASWKVEHGEVTFEQAFEVRDTLTPAAEYGKLREFFGKVGGAQASAVVLVKK
jgi:hypothetical protein